MKGAIVQCLGDLVKSRFGNKNWEESLDKAGMSRTTFFTPIQNVDDQKALKLLQSVCSVLRITPVQAADAFGEYWVNVYAPKIYDSYYRGAKSAKEFLIKMDSVHANVTDSIPFARPPRFGYEWLNDRTLVMTYKSQRGLTDIFVGLIKGVGKYYNEDLKISKLGKDRVQIVFPK